MHCRRYSVLRVRVCLCVSLSVSLCVYNYVCLSLCLFLVRTGQGRDALAVSSETKIGACRKGCSSVCIVLITGRKPTGEPLVCVFCVCLCVSVCVFVSLCVCVCLSVCRPCVFFSLSLSVCVCVSVCLCVSLSVCVCVSVLQGPALETFAALLIIRSVDFPLAIDRFWSLSQFLQLKMHFLTFKVSVSLRSFAIL